MEFKPAPILNNEDVRLKAVERTGAMYFEADNLYDIYCFLAKEISGCPVSWTGLVDEDSITVQLTPKGQFQSLYVSKIEGNRVYVDSDHGEPLDFYFNVFLIPRLYSSIPKVTNHSLDTYFDVIFILSTSTNCPTRAEH